MRSACTLPAVAVHHLASAPEACTAARSRSGRARRAAPWPERRAAARYIGKVDDDAFVHVADLLALTRRLGATVPDRMQYVGMLTWSSWLPEKCAG